MFIATCSKTQMLSNVFFFLNDREVDNNLKEPLTETAVEDIFHFNYNTLNSCFGGRDSVVH